MMLGLAAVFALLAIFAAPVVPGLRIAFGAVCHQLPERSFAWNGIALPVCARCLGIYAGALAAALVPLRRAGLLSSLALALNVFQWISGAGALEMRFALGFALAWTGASYLIDLLHSDALRQTEPSA